MLLTKCGGLFSSEEVQDVQESADSDGRDEGSQGGFPIVNGDLAPDAEVILVHIVMQARSRMVGGMLRDGRQIEDDEKERALAYLTGFAHHLPEGIKVRPEVSVAEPVARGIVNFASHEQVDVIAMYTHDRNPVLKIVTGSVADAVRKTTNLIAVKVYRPKELALAKASQRDVRGSPSKPPDVVESPAIRLMGEGSPNDKGCVLWAPSRAIGSDGLRLQRHHAADADRPGTHAVSGRGALADPRGHRGGQAHHQARCAGRGYAHREGGYACRSGVPRPHRHVQDRAEEQLRGG
ncbi:MAG: universal stress protein [SAR202 cluster bacterium]|nr:universal stress protein [SAR202 cluster bacterium]